MARPVVSSGRLKARRRKRRALLGGALAFAALLIFGGFVWLSWAPFLRVTKIEVSGTKSLPPGELMAYAQQQLAGSYAFLFARNNVFLYPRAGIEAGLLEQYPTLRAADVHAKDFHTVEVNVAERQPVALWCPSAGSEQAGGCSYMDEQGLIYAPAPAYSDAPYVTYQGAATSTPQSGLKQYLTQDAFQSLAALVAALEAKETNDPVVQVAVDGTGDARVYFKDDFLLILSTKDDAGDVYQRFVLALQSDAFAGKQLSDFDYLDLRFGDKLYYKAKTASN